MEENMLSIIIPVYNADKYLNKCINSVINQTYKNLEIILVDDGSTDNSGKICDEWTKKDERIRCYHKNNEGTSETRKCGILKSHGDFIGFVDADDYVDKNMYKILIDGCVKYKINIGCCNKVRKYKEKYCFENFISENKKITMEEALQLLLISDPSMCNKIFKKELFENVKFPIQNFYEDILITPYLIEKSNGMYINKIYGYYYIQQPTSKIHGKFSLKKMDYIYNEKKICKYISKKYPKLKEVSDSAYVLALASLISDIYDARKNFNKEYTYILKEMKKVNYKSNKFIPKYKKIMIYCDLHHLIWLTNLLKKLKRN